MSWAVFDSNALSYVFSSSAAFDAPLDHAYARIKADNLQAAVTSITVQEVGVWARSENRWPAFVKALDLAFAVLPFDLAAAEIASQLQASAGHPGRIRPKGAQRRLISGWMRDAAIMGTAEAFDARLLVTADDADFQRFKPTARCEILVLTPTKA